MLLTAVDSRAQTAPSPARYSYADLADRALIAPIAVIATISDTIRLKPERAPGVAPGHARLYVEATADALIRGAGGLPPSVSYLVDVPLNAKGKAPKLKDTQVLLLARPVAGKPGELQLVAPDAQLPLTPDIEQRVRAILTEALRADAPPPITGITSAFHVDGTIPGEGETQIFLSTREHRPISISVLSRPGQEKQWSVALGEIVDQAAEAPPRDSLLWYRLACGLPRELPAEAVADLDAGSAQDARNDYRFVLEALGPCTRTSPLKR
ncbi:hypothetical protein GON01_05395 [Sphingomonas sp. MAH-20]|jgi:hypothetical protein|uniref:Uncharacterized protein n=2 Tax=Sphingomonas horti TaxID=2682842 RepID=A0A6I4IZW7_9SPHN|nr:hypothetical protein [Sphingomonas sp. CGMCC 1.13658]MBA2918406.1 hypothetical protein [Sphingomonas sp. CGMCC 1.13658]MVO77373.1 hypothetical protein [Sphingomonas horti]